MADVRESFTTLEGSSQEGLALRAVQQGDSVAAKNGSLAFGFKDSSGNAIAPALDASGNVPVSGPLTDTQLRATPVDVLGPLTDAELRATPVDVLGPLTDAELRASPVPVTFGAVVGDGRRVRGTIAGNAALTTVASLTLVNSKTYENLDFIVSCFRDTRFQVILSDNAVETVVADALTGPGAFSFHGQLSEGEIVTGATGTQLLLIKGINLNALSDMYAALSVKLAN
jgi:hypothetical protein